MTKLKKNEYSAMVSGDSKLSPEYVGQLIVTGCSDINLMSRKKLTRWLKVVTKEFGFINTKTHSRKVSIAGTPGLVGTSFGDNGDFVVRITTVRGKQRAQVNISFTTIINVDEILTAIVEDMDLSTLDWIFLDCNDGIEIVDDGFDDIFSKVKVLDEDDNE
jgi:hypothetical protein